MEIRLVAADLFHADAQRDKYKVRMTNLIVALRNFANLPKKSPLYNLHYLIYIYIYIMHKILSLKIELFGRSYVFYSLHAQ
jgi:hypothetical protein